MEVLVLEIEDPGCFWVTMKGCGPYIVDEIEYENLNAEMNQFYDKSYKDMDEVKPLTVEEGQICVVFSEELKCWCRAVIKSIMYCTDHYKTECFLVDYAKYIFVKSKDIRVALEAFMQIPYRAKKCRLYRTKPVTLRIDFCEDTAKIVPANRWDSAATHYFQNLLKATTQMKAKLCAVEDNTFDVFLYVTIKDEKVCVNDDLVSKNFARFEEAKDNTGSSADYQENQTSLNLESLPVKIVNSALAFRPVPFQEKVLTNLETDLAVSRLFPEDTHQRSSTDLNESTAPTVKEIPGLSFKENTAVHTDRFQQFLNSDPLKTHIIEDEQQVVRPCTSSERTAVLLKILDFTHNDLQKVLVFTNSVNEAEMVHKALKSNSIISLKIHEGSEFDFKYILEQWTKKYSSGTRVVIVLTDDCMQSLGITDATCVIHFSFPSPRIFGQRLHSMSDNFCNVIKDSSVDQEYTKARSVFLLTEDNACHALGILRYLQHAEAEIPPELYDYSAKTLEAEEDKKLSRPLCAYLKTFGICKNRTVCPDRHQVNLQIDVPQNIPDKITQTPGCVTMLPLHIVNATNYFGRIVDKQKDQYTILAEEINEYFKKPCNKISVKNVEKLAFYGLCEKTLFHRVQVVDISPKEEENLFFNVKIKYIDEGRTSQVQSYQLLHLPARFQCLPPQAVEFVVCRVKPIDNEIEWDPKVTHYINDKIKGKLHEAKIVHTLGNTAWVDPMVRVTRLSDLKMSVNEYNVRSEILSTGLGTDNPEHITQLQKLCGHMDVLHHEKNLDPLSIKEDTAGPENASNPQNMSIQENPTENCNSFKITSGNHPCDGVAQSKEAEDSTLHQHKCFYPEIKWFQNEETVTVKVKIASVADFKCEFSKEKVIFSASSGDKLYWADMELHQYILAEKSTCVIKDKEAIIVLTKEKKGAWCKLLKNKNPHVSFDFQHWEDFEDESPFPVGTKKLYCTAAVAEELVASSEDSGTESDE
ncbi:putative ATP-dependent RNA helicase TDRD12 isoform X7 [Balearica regulorum gibbericeps]|uniref:putative ATP-dependent RNA helicase TDRD12 isoform X7 n=1 Tax=Balearica regulorum gibbericeps TaxID=100784 RepID=UPI003F5FEF90